MDIILNIINFALVMGIVVFIHELGHLLAAKAFGVYCNEFAIGMGPKLFSIKRPNWETTYSIRLLPIGGFVSMAGEPGEQEYEVEVERTIPGVAPWKRLIIMLAGIGMNILLTFVIFTGVFWSQGEVIDPDTTIHSVEPGGPADLAGLKDGDIITQIEFFDGDVVGVKTFTELATYIGTYGDTEMIITYTRDNISHTTSLTPIMKEDRPLIGIQGNPATIQPINFFEAMGASISYMVMNVQSLIFVIGRLFRGIGTNAIGGPIQIFQITSEVKNNGFLYFVQLVGLFSLNLAVLNLLPIPVLDGGRAFLTIVEMIIRRPLPKKFENIVMIIGAGLVISFMVFIIYNDIWKLFR